MGPAEVALMQYRVRAKSEPTATAAASLLSGAGVEKKVYDTLKGPWWPELGKGNIVRSKLPPSFSVLQGVQRKYLELGGLGPTYDIYQLPIVIFCTSLNPLHIHSLHGQLGQQTGVTEAGTWTSGMVL